IHSQDYNALCSLAVPVFLLAALAAQLRAAYKTAPPLFWHFQVAYHAATVAKKLAHILCACPCRFPRARQLQCFCNLGLPKVSNQKSSSKCGYWSDESII